MAANGHLLFHQMNAPDRFPDSLSDGSQSAYKLKTMHYDIAAELASIRASVSEHWQGDAADAAKGKLDRFLKSSAETAEKLDPAVVSMERQSDAFFHAKSSMQEMPPQPEEGSNGFVQLITFGYADSPEEKQAQWDAKNRANIEAYEAYSRDTTGNETQFKTDYRGVEDAKSSDPGGERVSSGGSVGGRSAGTPSVGGGSGSWSGGSGGYGGAGGATSTSAVPHVNAPAASAGAGYGGAGATSPSGYVPPSGAGTGSTAPSGYGPGGYGPGGFGPGSGYDGQFGPGGRYGKGGAGSAGASGGGVVGGFGPVGGGFGPGGAGAAGGAGSGSGSAGGLGAGGRSGVGMSPMGGSPAGGAAAAGAAGRGGMGAGMMGAGAGRGQGGEDSEHQRKYGLDSDEWFKPERDEDGGVLRDPLTGMPVVPPVIGE